jgi:multidrug efflux system membrane fusion protein
VNEAAIDTNNEELPMTTPSSRYVAHAASGRIRLVVVLIVVAIAAVIVVGGYFLARSTTPAQIGGGRFGRGGPGGPGAPGGPAMPVGAAEVAAGDINITLNALGTVTPLRNVTVSAQISGQLLEVKFKEGQMVQQGDVLAEIDPRPYQAALMQAEGALARDQALLANSKIDLERYQTLFKQDSIAKQQLDSQDSLVHQYEGTVKSDQAQIQTAKVNLTYTKINAPVSGRVGLRMIDPGNNVQNGGGIIVITQLSPIDVLFTLPEDSLPPVLKKMHAATPLDVDVYDRSGQTRLQTGVLSSLDNQIDTATGTVKAKAEFANADESLFPNQFVNVRVLLDVLHGATVIPTSALQRGANGLFVYVVATDRSVSVRAIKTGPTEGERVAVTSGLKVGETIVTDGADKLREGSKVELPGDAPPPGDAAQGQGQQAERQRGQGQQREGQQGQGERRRHDGSGGPGTGKPADGAQPATGKPQTPATDAKPADGRQ